MNYSIQSWFKNQLDSFGRKLENSILSNKSLRCKVVSGPVHSRRLGNVIGISNVSPKICSYNCIYCPSGVKSCCSVCRDYCLSPYELHLAVKKKLEELKRLSKRIEYIAFLGSGEPTLDLCLSKEILLLREFGYPIAVFTNSSLIWNDNVQENLMFADYVSVKIDTVNEQTWLKMNRPHCRLNYNLILAGINQFSKKYQGMLTTETMLIKKINDKEDEIFSLAEFLNKLNSSASYFTTPIYPSLENFAISPDTEGLKQLSKIIKAKVNNQVLLCCPAEEEFFATHDFENELMGIMALHPVHENAVRNFINNKNDFQKLAEMIEKGIVKEIKYNGKIFLMENFNTI